MHTVSTQFTNIIANDPYSLSWNIKVIPDYSVTEQFEDGGIVTATGTKNGSNPDLLRTDPFADTCFYPNTARAGPMYLQAATGKYFGVQSNDYTLSDGTLSAPMTASFNLALSDGTFLPYWDIGFSTENGGGCHAVDFDITVTYADAVGTQTRTVSVRNYNSAIYRLSQISDIQIASAVQIKIIKWSAGKTHAILTRIFCSGVPFTVTNAQLIEAPSVVKELESQSETAGSSSADQITFTFLHDNITIKNLRKGGLVDVKCGIKTDDFEELVPYGKYYIKSPSIEKSKIKIVAEDGMSKLLNAKPINYSISTQNRSYKDYIDSLLTASFKDDKSIYEKTMTQSMTPDNWLFLTKNARSANWSEHFDEFCVLTGSCIAYDDNADLSVYSKFKTGAAVDISDSLIINLTEKQRFMPASIAIDKYDLIGTTPSTGSWTEIFDGNVSVPAYSEIGTNVYTFLIEYSENVYVQDAYSPSGDVNDEDEFYGSSAILRRQIWTGPTTKKQQGFNVVSDSTFAYTKEPRKFKRQIISNLVNNYEGQEFFIKSYIAPVDGYSRYVNDYDYSLAIDYTFDAIYEWFRKTRGEIMVEVPADPRYEKGDLITASGKTGILYRIDLGNGTMKLTIRGDFD